MMDEKKRLPNRILEKIDIKANWEKKLKPIYDDIIYEIEEYDSVFFNKASKIKELLVQLVYFHYKKEDFNDREYLIKNDVYYSKVKEETYDELKKRTYNKISALIVAGSDKNYFNNLQIELSSEEKDKFKKFIIELDNTATLISKIQSIVLSEEEEKEKKEKNAPRKRLEANKTEIEYQYKIENDLI